MVRRKTITLGDGENARQFDIGPITLGTVRRVGAAFQVAAAMDTTKPRIPTADEFDAMIALVHDAIVSVTPNAITLAALNALLDDLDMMDGIRQITAAVGELSKLTRKPAADSGDGSGNSLSSENAKSPVSSD